MFDTMLDLGRLRITILCKETIPTVSSFFLITFKGNHRQDHQDDVIMVGWLGDQLGYNSSLGQWIIQSSNQFIYTGYMSNNPDDKNSLSDIFCLAHQWLLEDLSPLGQGLQEGLRPRTWWCTGSHMHDPLLELGCEDKLQHDFLGPLDCFVVRLHPGERKDTKCQN